MPWLPRSESLSGPVGGTPSLAGTSLMQQGALALTPPPGCNLPGMRDAQGLSFGNVRGRRDIPDALLLELDRWAAGCEQGSADMAVTLHLHGTAPCISAGVRV